MYWVKKVVKVKKCMVRILMMKWERMDAIIGMNDGEMMKEM
jgi:hypothetical protein